METYKCCTKWRLISKVPAYQRKVRILKVQSCKSTKWQTDLLTTWISCVALFPCYLSAFLPKMHIGKISKQEAFCLCFKSTFYRILVIFILKYIEISYISNGYIYLQPNIGLSNVHWVRNRIIIQLYCDPLRQNGDFEL